MSTNRLRMNVNFVLCLAILAGSAVGMRYAQRAGMLQLIKKRLPIRKPLDDFDRSCLPFANVSSKTLSPDIISELGTEEYINWFLDQGPGKRRGSRPVVFSVTYYTGVQDQVPHVPEECLYQANFGLEQDESIVVHLAEFDQDVAVRRLVFAPPATNQLRGGRGRTIVYYTFGVNGRFCADRDCVRRKMLNPRESHLYYSKVELTYTSYASEDGRELDEQARELLRIVVSELIRSHWPLAESVSDGPRSTVAGA